MLTPILPKYRKRRGRLKSPAPATPPTPEDDVLTGTLLAYAGATVPAGYLECDGSAVSRATYAALFEALGTAYGSGDGSTTFNLPDLRGRALLGAGTGDGLTPRARGNTGGAESVAIDETQLANHRHTYASAYLSTNSGEADGSGTSFLTSASLDSGAGSTSDVGLGVPHENMIPFGVARWMVKI